MSMELVLVLVLRMGPRPGMGLMLVLVLTQMAVGRQAFLSKACLWRLFLWKSLRREIAVLAIQTLRMRRWSPCGPLSSDPTERASRVLVEPGKAEQRVA